LIKELRGHQSWSRVVTEGEGEITENSVEVSNIEQQLRKLRNMLLPSPPALASIGD
jgi:hypothetical protein